MVLLPFVAEEHEVAGLEGGAADLLSRVGLVLGRTGEGLAKLLLEDGLYEAGAVDTLLGGPTQFVRDAAPAVGGGAELGLYVSGGRRSA